MRFSMEKMAFKAMSEIQGKSNWKEKVWDEEIVGKWRVSSGLFTMLKVYYLKFS